MKISQLPAAADIDGTEEMTVIQGLGGARVTRRMNAAQFAQMAPRGFTGKSAYEDAVAGGFVGTVAQWIASLKAVNGGVGSSAGFAGLFAAAAGMEIGADITRVHLAGNAAANVGAGWYIYDAALNALNVGVGINAGTAFISAGGKGFRLDPAQKLTPEMFGANGAAADNRAALQRAIDFAKVHRSEIVFQTIYDVAPATDGAVILDVSNASGVTFSGLTKICGVKVKNNAGNYAAVFDLGGAVAHDVDFKSFTIDQNAQGNTTANLTIGTEGRRLMAIRSFASQIRRVKVRDVHFKNSCGVNTLALNSPDNRACEVASNHFSFFPSATATPRYDNSAIYMEGSHYTVAHNEFENLGAYGDARSAVECHGHSFQAEGNISDGYQIGGHFVANFHATADMFSSMSGNTAKNCHTGYLIWALTGRAVSYFDVSRNRVHIDLNLYLFEIGTSNGVGFADDPACLGDYKFGKLNSNIVSYADYVGDGSHPGDQSAGIALQPRPGASMSDIEANDNVVINAPNIGINIFQQSGTARRISANRNRVIDAGHNVANALRFAFLWRGIAADSECIGTRIIDTSTTATPKGLNGLNTSFVLAGSSLVEDDNQHIMSGTGYLTHVSSQYASAERVGVLAWVTGNPFIKPSLGVRLFTLDMTTVVGRTLNNDPITKPLCAANTRIAIRVKNSSGGAPALTFAAAFKLQGGAFATPANGTTTTIEFVTPDGGTSWLEVSRMNVTH